MGEVNVGSIAGRITLDFRNALNAIRTVRRELRTLPQEANRNTAQLQRAFRTQANAVDVLRRSLNDIRQTQRAFGQEGSDLRSGFSAFNTQLRRAASNLQRVQREINKVGRAARSNQRTLGGIGIGDETTVEDA